MTDANFKRLCATVSKPNVGAWEQAEILYASLEHAVLENSLSPGQRIDLIYEVLVAWRRAAKRERK